MEAVLASDDNRPLAGLILANLCLAEGKPEEALERLLQAERSTRPAPEIRHTIGRVYLKSGRYAEAARAFRNVLALDPEHAMAMLGLARMKRRAGTGRRRSGRWRRSGCALACRRRTTCWGSRWHNWGRGSGRGRR
ncbi:MAG: tetratricopeptide repeat protein [Terriglobales bacterium]